MVPHEHASQYGIGEMMLSRTFDAPRELVFEAWTRPEHMSQWWGPAGFTNPVCELDVRPGGVIRIEMHGPDGDIFPMSGVFDEVVAPSRLVFTSAPHETPATVSSGKRESVKNCPLTSQWIRTTVTFVAQAEKTVLTVRAELLTATPEESSACLDGMKAGWNGSLERLVEHLADALASSSS